MKIEREFVFIFIGLMSYSVFFWIDYLDLIGKKTLKVILWVVGLILHSYAVFGLVLSSDKINFNFAVKCAGYIFGGLFFVLLIYSVFIEIPLYRKKGLSKNNGLVTKGTYSLCRHPGVLWYIGFLISLFFITGSKPMLIAVPLWGIADIVYAWYQDKYYFVRIFGYEYTEYKKKVPIFFPRIFRLSVKNNVFLGKLIGLKKQVSNEDN